MRVEDKSIFRPTLQAAKWNNLSGQFWSQQYNPLDKDIIAEFEQRDVTSEHCANFFKAALEDPKSRFLIFSKGKILMTSQKDTDTKGIFWLNKDQLNYDGFGLSFEELVHISDIAGPVSDSTFDARRNRKIKSTSAILLGKSKVDEGLFFGINMSKMAPADAVQLLKPDIQPDVNLEFVHPRALLVKDANAEELAIIGVAVSRLSWHEETQFCHMTGEPLFCTSLGHRLKPLASREHPRPRAVYPRLDPVAICLVISKDGNRALLGERSQYYNSGFFSCLAGFVEQGESVEDAVRREVFEESGVIIGNEVEVIGTQSWPIGSAGHSELMIACIATAETDEINFDEHELGRCEWFEKYEVQRMLKNSDNTSLVQRPLPTTAGVAIDIEKSKKKIIKASTPEERMNFRVPPTYAIAHHVIKAWVEHKPAGSSSSRSIQLAIGSTAGKLAGATALGAGVLIGAGLSFLGQI